MDNDELLPILGQAWDTRADHDRPSQKCSALCSDLSPQGGATERHAAQPVLNRFASCSSAAETDVGMYSFFSSRIDTNSACSVSIVRCMGVIVAWSFSRKGISAASIAAVMMFANSEELARDGL